MGIYDGSLWTGIPDELEITAWSASPGPGAVQTVQGLAHREYPIWGVQYHPEVYLALLDFTVSHQVDKR